MNIAKPTMKELLKEIHKLISEGLIYASYELLEFLSNRDQLLKYKHHFEYLKAKNIEVAMNYNCLCSDNAIVSKYISRIRVYFDYGQYDLVIKEASKALYNTNYPIFYYYLGKAYYKNQNYDLAIDYFNEYKKLHTEKFAKANLYLYSIYRYKKDFSKANKFISDIEDIEATYQEYTFNYFNYIPYSDKNNKFQDKYDSKPAKILQKIYMKEEDFLKRD